MKLCIDLRFKKNSEGKLILQARWQPVQFSGTYAIQLAGDPTDFIDVDLINDVLPVTLDPIVGITAADPVETITQTLKSKEEEDAKQSANDRNSGKNIGESKSGKKS